MIISRTPFRISFFGGGTDFPSWFNNSRGKIISTTINKYCYISLRVLPPFFKYNYRLRYFIKEEVKKVSNIKHPVIRETIKYLKFKENLEVVHHADLPAQSGLGASSSFTVGFLNGMLALSGKRISKRNLSVTSIKIEQDIIKEIVGCQDQIAASFGGFNIINFENNSFEVNTVSLKNKNLSKIEESLFLVFSGYPRNAAKIELNKLKKFNFNQKYYNAILDIADKAEDKLYNSENIVSDFSELMEKYWWNKKKLSEDVTNSKINKLYNAAIKNGAYAGKLVGAGGGGFMMFFIDPKKKKNLLEVFKNKVVVPIKFTQSGSQIIYEQNNI